MPTRCLLPVLLLLAGCQPLVSAEPGQGFHEILGRQTRATFQEIAGYVQAHPDAPDAPEAYRWLFDNASSLGWEVEALPICEAFFKTGPGDPALQLRAQQVQGIGYAKSGKSAEALEILDAQLRALRPRAGNSSGAIVDFALQLTAELQAAGKIDDARQVFQRMTASFLVPANLKELAERRLARLALVGKPCPQIEAVDWDGQRIALADYEGKVVVLDFWATNCPPCLAAFPELKRLYADLHPKGFEMVGFSLDEDEEVAKAYQKQAGLGWRMAMEKQTAGEVGEPFHVPTIPAVFVLDKTGKIVACDVTGRPLRTILERLLAE